MDIRSDPLLRGSNSFQYDLIFAKFGLYIGPDYYKILLI